MSSEKNLRHSMSRPDEITMVPEVPGEATTTTAAAAAAPSARRNTSQSTSSHATVPLTYASLPPSQEAHQAHQAHQGHQGQQKYTLHGIAASPKTPSTPHQTNTTRSPLVAQYQQYYFAAAGDDGADKTCLLWLLFGDNAGPIYRFLNSPSYLMLSTASMVIGLVVGTLAAVTDAIPDSRFCLFAVLILPMHLQRLLLLDFVILTQLLREFECLFILANWILIFPALGRMLGLGFRLVYFILWTLAFLPALMSDASRDASKTVFRNMLYITMSIIVMSVWVYVIEAELIPLAFYDKPLLLREDRLAESVGPAKDILISRLLILICFSLKYLYNCVIYPMNYVLLRAPLLRRREEEAGEDAAQGGEKGGMVVVTRQESNSGRNSRGEQLVHTSGGTPLPRPRVSQSTLVTPL